MSQRRPQRVADQLRLELARLLREEVRDPRVGFVTLTEVELSPDLRHARVFVTVLDQDEQTTLAALRRATPFLRRTLARGAGLRFTPELRFVIDRSVADGFRVDSLLDEIAHDRARRGAADDPVDDGEDAS